MDAFNLNQNIASTRYFKGQHCLKAASSPYYVLAKQPIEYENPGTPPQKATPGTLGISCHTCRYTKRVAIVCQMLP